MSKINSVPPIVQQIIEAMLNEQNTDNVKFNNKLMLENIIEVSTSAINTYNKNELKRKFKK
jgi:hypothetical protein